MAHTSTQDGAGPAFLMALLDKLGSASATPDTAILARWADVCSLVDARANLCAAWLRLPKVLHTALCYVGNNVQSKKRGDDVIMSTHQPICVKVATDFAGDV
jgi:hypothetical protein